MTSKARLMKRVIGCVVIAWVFWGLTPTTGYAVPIAHWKFDEVGGGTAFDSVGTYHGTLAGTTAAFVGGGISGNAISLDRTKGDLVNMGDVLPLTAGDFSIAAWIRTASSDGSTVVSKIEGGPGVPNGYFLMLNVAGAGIPNRASFYLPTWDPGQWVNSATGTVVNNNNWHQIIGVYHDTTDTAELYVDGAWEASRSGLTPVPTSVPFLVGGYTSWGSPLAFFTGLIDDVRVYNHALTSGEVQWLYQHPGQMVPEPATLTLLGVGLAGLAFFAYRRKKT